MIKTIEGALSADNVNIAVVISRWNEFINQHLLSGALGIFKRLGGDENNIFCVHVPGAFEIPVICARIAEKNSVDGILAIGTVIKGETAHFEHIAGATINGISHVSIQHKIPIGMCILTTENTGQAIERAGAKAGNKGAESMTALIETIGAAKLL